MPNDLAAWLAYLERLHPVGIDMGLERVREVAMRLGLLESSLAPKVITVAGTNGKGSTLAIIAAVASAHGQRVGAYTSPHLVRYNERITLHGEPASDDVLVAGFEAIEHARLKAPEVSLTYFEAGTLCALWCFANAELDLVLLEVGLGGRLDAVNIVDADIGVVTTIALDHANFLGTDLEQIGREKAGILRPRHPAVLGSETLPDSVQETAKALNAPLFALGQAFRHVPQGEGGWEWHGSREDGQAVSWTELPVPGLPLDNAATALQTLTLAGLSLDAATTRDALASVTLPGRMQWLGQWCLDVGHNPHAAAYVASRLPSPQGRLWCLVGMLDDKDADTVIAHLMPRVTDWVCVSLAGSRGRSATSLKAVIEHQSGCVRYCGDTPEEGAKWLGRELTTRDIVLATGSFFTVGALLNITLPQAPHEATA
ncbi:bifunctional tetrahydrofolate synthase/dihydrofolate synthase [Halomonas vilamensis]|uniref:Dihydrofolate synthase/folylpolyglutamate synthase n=1 Tax=Vreelandella vilamensis TaxID=531309 RepID=A0ABU1H936_9GAMM|nr:bifunctional tetrahydrofolate synthase/dihydrofolate synthase [Halomonas vilamensis]MDR5900227.1 bifunctional tetrahydrofolate synthase/dihydrofolate synthase [Halomonas vilamensis]